MTRVKTHFSQNLSANFFKLESYLVIQNGKKRGQELFENDSVEDPFNLTVFKQKFTA